MVNMYNLDDVENSHANGKLELDKQADSNSLSVHGYSEISTLFQQPITCKKAFF